MLATRASTTGYTLGGVPITASACALLTADIDIQVVGLIRMLIDPDLHLRPDLGGDKQQMAVSPDGHILRVL